MSQQQAAVMEDSPGDKGIPLPDPPPPARKRVFFLIQVDDLKVGMVVFELYNDQVPITCENFRVLCTGMAGRVRNPHGIVNRLHYRGTRIHCIIKDFIVQAGDITKGDGSGGASIYANGTESFGYEGFDQENLGWRQIDSAGLLCMANRGGNKSNTSQFFITLSPAHYLTHRYTVFGHVIDGMDIIEEIGKIQVGYKDSPNVKVEIVESGELTPSDQVRVLSPPAPITCRPLKTTPTMPPPHPKPTKGKGAHVPGHKRTHSKQATMLEAQQEAAAAAAGRGDIDENRSTKRRVVMFERRDDDYDTRVGGPSTKSFARKYHGPRCSPREAPPPARARGHRPRSPPLVKSHRDHGGGHLYPRDPNEGEYTSDEEEGREISKHHGHSTYPSGNNRRDRHDNRTPSQKYRNGRPDRRLIQPH
ncbi:cyclophilin-like domain-containing protein [Tuber brumale]|nr:cyclophilin-like domain-containing protein [Tuber brumale]